MEHDHGSSPTVGDLWQLVQEQRRRIDELETAQRRRRRAWPKPARRQMALGAALLVVLALVVAPAAFAGTPTPAMVWSLAGNSGSDPVSQYLGTADNKPLVVKTNKTEAMRVLPGSNGVGGRVGIGTANPTTTLDVNGAIHGSSTLGIGSNATIGGNLAVAGVLSASSVTEGTTPLSSRYATVDGANATAGSTWGINVSGNAGAVTNGVYTTGDQSIGGAKTFSDHLSVSNGITANGSIASTAGGFTFPDGTTQTTAATKGSITTHLASQTFEVPCCAADIYYYQVPCPRGYEVMGGGFEMVDTSMHVWQSFPGNNTWYVSASADFGPSDLGVWAQCLKFTP